MVVEDGIGDKLAALAGGERKKGDYLSKVIESLYLGELDADATNSLEMQKILMSNLLGRVRALEGQVSALIAVR